MDWIEITTFYPNVTKRLRDNDLIGADRPKIIGFLEDSGISIDVNKVDEHDDEGHDEGHDEIYLTEDAAIDAAIVAGIQFLEDKFTAQDNLLKRSAN